MTDSELISAQRWAASLGVNDLLERAWADAATPREG